MSLAKKFPINRWFGDVLAFIIGSLMPIAFAPVSFAPFAIIGLAALFFLWQDIKIERAVWRGFLFGVGMFGIGISWVYISFHDFGNLPMIVALLLTAGFVIILASYIALLAWVHGHYMHGDGIAKYVLLLPAAWTMLEWIRSWFLSGFPWLSLGYTQIDTPLNGFAPIFGVYGISWATAMTAGVIVYILRARQWGLEELFVTLFFVGALWGGAWGLQQQHWYTPVDSPVKVALIQGNVPNDFKWEGGLQERTAQNYWALSQANTDVDLIVWGETAIPEFLHYPAAQDLLALVQKQQQVYGTDFLIGLPFQDVDGKYYNSVLSLSEKPALYHKNHLVPFGEYIPFHTWVGGLLDMFELPMSSFTAGENNQPNLIAAGQIIGMSICYEDTFGERIRTALPEATLLVNVSNDSWFGNSLAPHQHLEMARMRALEAGRYLLRSTNTGISAIIDPQGKIALQAPQFAIHALRAQVQPLTGTTPFVRFGNWLVVALLALVLGFGYVLHQRWLIWQRKQVIF